MVCVWPPIMTQFPFDGVFSACFLVPLSLLIALYLVILGSLIWGISPYDWYVQPFFSYRVSSSKENVHITNGSLPFVVGTCCIPFTSSFSLSSVFHVPNFQLNLVFVSHITNVLNCSIIFFLPIVFPGFVDKENAW